MRAAARTARKSETIRGLPTKPPQPTRTPAATAGFLVQERPDHRAAGFRDNNEFVGRNQIALGDPEDFLLQVLCMSEVFESREDSEPHELTALLSHPRFMADVTEAEVGWIQCNHLVVVDGSRQQGRDRDRRRCGWHIHRRHFIEQ